MFVFPANDDSYRKRRRAHKACEQCKRRRKRCEAPFKNHERCAPCTKAGISCSLVAAAARNDDLDDDDDDVEQTSASIKTDVTPVRPPLVRSHSAETPRSASSSHYSILKPSRPQLSTTVTTSSTDPLATTISAGLDPSISLRSPQLSPFAPNHSDNDPHLSSSLAALNLPFGSPPSQIRSSAPNYKGKSASSPAASAAATAAAAAAPVASSTAAVFEDTIATPAAHEHMTARPTKKSKLTGANSSFSASVATDPTTSTTAGGSTIPTDTTFDSDTSSRVPTEPTAVGSTRFIGDLDPASVILTLRNVEKDEIGVWVKGASIHQPLNKHLLTYLDSLHAFDLPPKRDREGLIHTYFKFLHPLLPLLDKTAFLKMHARDECPTLLLHAVLLSACRHPSARKYLQSRSPRYFASLTATKIRALMFAEIERDKLTVVRVLALLSLHSEGSDGLEKSCSDLEKAFHYAHFLGIHHERRSHPDQAPMRRLWWCLWCLDRISACVSARPVISRLDDVGVSGLREDEEGWLPKLYEVCKLLDSVIAMYRPMGSTLPPEVDFEVTYGDSDDSPIAALLHLLRHAACILAHKRAPESPEANAAMLLHSTRQILYIVKTVPALPPLPAVPYAVSLTLTVYLRLFPSPEAIEGWHESCAVLDDLSKTWWVAEAMGGMARSVFRKLEENLADRQTEEAAPAPVAHNFKTRGNAANSKKRKETKGAKSGVSFAEPSVSYTNQIPSPSGANNDPPSIYRQTPGDTSTPSTQAPTISVPASTSLDAPTPSLETQFLEMFSDLPNPTSFLDQALMLDDIEADIWIPNLQFDDPNDTNSSITAIAPSTSGSNTNNHDTNNNNHTSGSNNQASSSMSSRFNGDDFFNIPGFHPASSDESMRFF
ncbi:hypothetical protein BZA70DRAFT_271143 [Myxozyma melibiosi]|uniref:Zn(2)-C6 fungal-type domain-containing protein n=1 Tax=Myxozyma melibiosi TaxID=54550 RepID=A0ABR1FBZ8_9ASCO